MATRKGTNRSVVAMGTVARTVGKQSKQLVRRVADAVLIIHVVVVVAVLAAGARFLL